jgi:hypothetical protein
MRRRTTGEAIGADRRPAAQEHGWNFGLSARECSWQPEPWKHRVLEASHRTDLIASESKDEEADAVADAR